jgi:ubiquinone/menaquinone biosynthesis C-methylase UbiE
MTTPTVAQPPVTKGVLVRWAAPYDLLIWLVTFGRERQFRERLLGPAKLQPGESVLDVGCGTGTLALAAKRSVGPSGSVRGIDAAPEMIERARHKARKASAEISFDTALAESLPFPDGTFDVVTSTVMLHHLPRAIREKGLREMARVLKPGGRLLAVDFGDPGHGGGFIALLHRHGRIRGNQLADLVSASGLQVAESGPLGMWDLRFAIGRKRSSP